MKTYGKFQRAKARRGVTPVGQMNRTEAAYSEELEIKRLAGEIVGWRFEPIRLRLAKLTYYTPDFMVQYPDGVIMLHEVKACKTNGSFLIEDDARVKIKIAAATYPEFPFWLCGRLPKSVGGGWKYEEVTP